MKVNNKLLPQPILVLIIVFLIGAILRLWGINTQGFWHDEIYSLANLNGFDAYLFQGSDLLANSKVLAAREYVQMLGHPRFLETLERNILHEGHPPLYQIILKSWSVIMGTSETSLRALSSFAALMTLLVIYKAGDLLESREIGAKAALLLATSPFHVFFSIEARSYSLAILFCSLATLAGVAISTRPKPSYKIWIVWIISTTAAFYTHYYAGIYCAVMALSIAPLIPKKNIYRFLWILPFGLFLIWTPFFINTITLQSKLHWTYGTASIGDSIGGMFSGLIDILTGPRQSAPSSIRLFATILLLISFFGLVVKNTIGQYTEKRLMWVIVSFILLIYAVDIITNHHTILIPRYISFCQPALLLLLAIYFSRLKTTGNILLLLLTIVSIQGSLLTISGERAPKQMLREAAVFINEKYSPGDQILVTPNGPTLLGLSLYLNPNALIAGVSEENVGSEIMANLKAGHNTWLIRQRLGSEYIQLEKNITKLDPLESHYTRFVGLDLYKYNA